MKKMIFTLVMICMGFSALVAQKRVAFLVDPTVTDQQVGVQSALTSAGYIVEVQYHNDLPWDATALEAYDLIVVSKAVSSGDFQAAFWNSIKTPIIILSPQAVRSSRLKLINSTSMVSPSDGTLVDPTLITYGTPVANKTGGIDPVFKNVTTYGVQFGYFKWMYCYLNYTLTNWAADLNTGKPLVTLPDTAISGAGVVLMARWEPGVEAYPGSGILSGRRTYMDIGTDDGADPQKFNYDNYTDTSLQLFLNEAENLTSPAVFLNKKVAFLADPSVTQDQQVGVQKELKNAGYTVEVQYTPWDATTLNAYDLIVVSKAVSSGDFQAAFWNDIKTPVIVLSPQAVRSSRMKLVNSTSMVSPADGALIDPALITKGAPIANTNGGLDPVFKGVTTKDSTFGYFKWMYCYLNCTLDKWAADLNTGKPLVVLSDTAVAGARPVLMARWEPGVEAYPGSGILAGRRTYMDIGTDDGADPQNFNYDNYTESSIKLFLNEAANLTTPQVGIGKHIAFLADPSVTQDQQVGVQNELISAGYSVEVQYTPWDPTALEAYDLIVVSKAVSSGDFQAAFWNEIKTPVIVLSPQAVRSSRMKLVNSTSMVSPANGALIDSTLVTKGAPVTNVNGSLDPVFKGVTTAGKSFGYFTWMYCYLNATLDKWAADQNTGKPLVVLADTAIGGARPVLMARWEPGVEAYPGSGILAGRRTYMDIGTDDGADPQNFNYDNYTNASLKLFMNEVANLSTPQVGLGKHIAFLADPGVLMDQQVGVQNELTSAGYTVEVQYTPWDATALNAYDLIVVSKAVSSGDFQAAFWNDIKTPVIVLSPQAVRSSRMKLLNSTSMVSPADGSLIDSLAITNGSPIANIDGTYDNVFSGVTSHGSAFGYYKWMYCYVNYTLDNWAADNNTGKPLVVLANNAVAGARPVLMARWEPGVEAYAGSGILGGRRSYMAIGTDDGSDPQKFNYDNYTDASIKLFMNEVAGLMTTINTNVPVSPKSGSALRVWPNPSTNGNFNVELKDSKSQTANIKIYTVIGQQVYNNNFANSGNIIINSGLNRGIYLMVVGSEGKVSTQKVVIK